MITSPDGEGVILSGGVIDDELFSNGMALNTFYELRRKSASDMELVWTLLDQTMAIPREGHVMFAISDDYCEYYIDDLISTVDRPVNIFVYLTKLVEMASFCLVVLVIVCPTKMVCELYYL